MSLSFLRQSTPLISGMFKSRTTRAIRPPDLRNKIDRRLSVGRQHHGVTAVSERARRRPAHHLFVVDYQNRAAVTAPRSFRRLGGGLNLHRGSRQQYGKRTPLAGPAVGRE